MSEAVKIGAGVLAVALVALVICGQLAFRDWCRWVDRGCRQTIDD